MWEGGSLYTLRGVRCTGRRTEMKRGSSFHLESIASASGMNPAADTRTKTETQPQQMMLRCGSFAGGFVARAKAETQQQQMMLVRFLFAVWFFWGVWFCFFFCVLVIFSRWIKKMAGGHFQVCTFSSSILGAIPGGQKSVLASASTG